MNLNFNNKLFSILLGTMILVPNFAIAKASNHPELKVIIAKFSIAMIGVALFSILIYIGLSLYNKFFVSDYITDSKRRIDSLASPRDKDEAITNFILKNRLK